jgi:hypothetical protein
VGYVLSVVNGGTVNFDALVVAGTAGETLSTSTLVYFATTTQRWNKVDTDSTATFQDVAIGLTRGAGTNGTSIGGGGVLLKGLQTGLSGQTAGATYYASSSAGNFNTATSVLPIGYAKSTSELYFDPVMIGVPRLAFNNTFTGTNSFSGTTTFTGVTTGFGTASTTLFTSTGTSTFTKNPFAKYVVVEVVGGGGGGGGADTDNNTTATGGGAGGYCREIYLASNLSATTTLFVGSGGANGTGASSPTAGLNASSSHFGTTLCIANGGAGGGTSPGSAFGGTATGGDINISGNPGIAIPINTNYGGSSVLGTGGVVTSSTGVAASGYGAGGTGGIDGSSFSESGGNGTNGAVIVTEYF